MSREGNARLGALDGLRGLAALGIVVLHVWMFDHGDANGGFNPQTVEDMAINELRLGVVLFFVLSGFLLYRPFLAAARGERPFPVLRSYARRRAARLLPAYWFALAGSFALLAWLEHPLRTSARELPVFLLFSQNYLTETAKRLDPPMWSLAVEVSFYAALPLIGFLALRAGPRRRTQLALCGALALAGVAYTALSVALAFPWTATATLPIHLTEFASGMAVAVLLHGRGIARRTGLALVAAGALLVLGNAAWHELTPDTATAQRILRDLPAAFGFALIVAAVAGAPLRNRALVAPPVRALGTLSYAIYLWHYVAIMYLRAEGWWPADLVEALVLTLLLTLPVSVLSWFAVERPALRWAKRPRLATAER
jgi:peptidoglycan/LPS O-acetylase OafA/YrhL